MATISQRKMLWLVLSVTAVAFVVTSLMLRNHDTPAATGNSDDDPGENRQVISFNDLPTNVREPLGTSLANRLVARAIEEFLAKHEINDPIERKLIFLVSDLAPVENPGEAIASVYLLIPETMHSTNRCVTLDFPDGIELHYSRAVSRKMSHPTAIVCVIRDKSDTHAPPVCISAKYDAEMGWVRKDP